MTATEPRRHDPGEEETRIARDAMNRAMRRLGVLEAILLGAAAIAALAGGWLAALLARSAFGFPFRTTWLVSSLLLFVIPGVLAWTMGKRGRYAHPKMDIKGTSDDSPGRGGG